MIAAVTPKAPHMDWTALSPLLALFGGATLVLLLGCCARASSATRWCR